MNENAPFIGPAGDIAMNVMVVLGIALIQALSERPRPDTRQGFVRVYFRCLAEIGGAVVCICGLAILAVHLVQ